MSELSRKRLRDGFHELLLPLTSCYSKEAHREEKKWKCVFAALIIILALTLSMYKRMDKASIELVHRIQGISSITLFFHLLLELSFSISPSTYSTSVQQLCI